MKLIREDFETPLADRLSDQRVAELVAEALEESGTALGASPYSESGDTFVDFTTSDGLGTYKLQVLGYVPLVH